MSAELLDALEALRVELMAAWLGFAPPAALHVGDENTFVTGHTMQLDKYGATFDLAYVGDLNTLRSGSGE